MLTLSELDRFNKFARQQLQAGNVTSLSECVNRWSEKQAYLESVAALRESLEDVAAGRTVPAAQVEEELRREFDLPPRVRRERAL